MSRNEQKLMTGWEFALMKKNPVLAQTMPTEKEETPDMPEGLAFETVDLPHDWAVGMPFNQKMEQGAAQGYFDRWGIGWYRKRLELAEKKEEHMYYLEFGAVYENCTIWINRQLAGSHSYGYSTFRLDITQLLRTGENEILVKVDNTTAPVDRWYSGCGIYRTVKLIEVEKEHFDRWDVSVHTEFDKEKAVVRVDAGKKACVKGSLRSLKEDGGQKYTDEAADGQLTFFIERPYRWSAEEPNLYELKLQLLRRGTMTDEMIVADEIRFRIGLREIRMTPGKGMYVNGQQVKLQGVCLHQEGGCLGNAIRPELWKERLAVLKEMGCNAIRAAHHTFAEEFLDLCDEMGFYVYEECFDKWKGGLYGRYFDAHWQSDVEAMVKRDRNRACIFIWGVGNEVENQAQDSMLSILQMLCDYVRSLDNTRPVTYAMNPHFKYGEEADLSHIKDIQQFVDEISDTEIYDLHDKVGQIKKIADIVDVISCNYQEQWYDLIHERIPDKLILGTEVYQFFSGHSEQMQNFSNSNPVLAVREKEYCIGSMIWTGYDYLGESMGCPAKGWSGAVIRTNGERRPGYYILKSYWSKEPVVYFAVMDYSLADEGVKEHWDAPIYARHWHFPQFRRTVIPYMIASNCEEVALYLNGKRFYIPKPSECPDGIITGFLPWQPGTVKAIGYKNGKEVCVHEVVTPGIAVQLSFRQETLTCPAEHGYQALLTVRAQDERGNHYFRESGKVRFRVEGPAYIKAVDNGDITSNEPFQTEEIHMYHGCASVVVAMEGTPGRVVVWADCAGMRSARCVILCGGETDYKETY
ncbi:MAG: DUF4982 domain-containing protein [Bacillus sp. (in: Bacteria)]|nr:DUF4982 domain-containing protein [Bacillus sp. (in: firmicutes)]MCM1425174.1 DUF4982 domain-containing protein [Eubacterium sp.]